MPFYRKIKIATIKTLIAISALCLAFNVLAGTGNIQVRNAELISIDDKYALYSDFDLNLNAVLEEALNKGVPLTFLVEFQVTSPRKYWFDDEIVTQSYRVSLSYHALSRQYLINKNNHQLSFSTLQQAKETLSRIKDWSVLDKSLLKKGEIYQAALRVRLDQSKLPKPLQVEASGSEDWNLVSDRYHWTPSLSF
jgi:hypothetical protein